MASEREAIFSVAPVAKVGSKSKGWYLVLSLAPIVIFSLSMGEFLFRFSFPPPMVVGSVRNNPNKERYGWGLGPHAPLPAVDPDSGRTIAQEKTNSKGWKDVEHSYQRIEARPRILVIGDSVTQGIPPIPATYHKRLEAYLNDRGCHAEVIALGYGGWATDQEYVAYLEEGRLYSPDIVISQFCDNDLLGLVGEDPYFDTSLKPFQARIRGQELILEKRTPSQAGGEWTNWLQAHSRLCMVTRHLWRSVGEKKGSSHGWPRATVTRPMTPGLRSPGDLDPSTSEQLNLYAALIGKWKAQCTEAGSLFFVFNPSSESGELSFALDNGLIKQGEKGRFIQQVVSGAWVPIDFHRPRQRIEEALRARGVEVVPLKRRYERYRVDSHPNGNGNKAMAEDIGDFLLAHPRASIVLSGGGSDQSDSNSG